MTTTTLTVSGMTCGHCVNHVTTALKELDGVTNVEVELEGGRVSIESETELESSVITAAVTAAGYSVAG